MLLILLLVLVAGIAVGSFFANDRELVAPAVLFAGGFTLSLAFATAYAGPWQFELHANTFFVLLLGILWFCLCATGVHYLAERRQLTKAEANKKGADSTDTATTAAVTTAELTHLAPARPLPLAIFAAIEVVVFAITLVAIQQLFPDQSLTAAIKSYNSANTFTTDGPELPRLLDHARMLCTGGAYFICYLLGQEIARGWRRTDWLVALCAALSVALILETGGRTSAIAYLIVAIIAYFVTAKRLHPERGGVPLKAVLIIAGICVAVLVLFKFMTIGGRGAEDRDIIEYLAMYLGAEIANLDTFLQSYAGQMPDLLGQMTLMRDWNYLGDKLGIAAWVYSPDLPFQYRGDYSMGNVYTVFYPFIYDFGYVGVAALTAIMAAVSQLVYEKAAHRPSTRWTDIWITVFCMVGFALLMSFFSNKFYEDVLSVNFVRNLLYVLIVRYLVSYFRPRTFAANVRDWVNARRAR